MPLGSVQGARARSERQQTRTITSFCSLASKVSAWPGGTVGPVSPGKLASPATARKAMAGARTSGVPACPVDKLDCRTRSQANGELFCGDLNMHTVIRRLSTASWRLDGVKGGHLTHKAADQRRPRPRWLRNCRSFGRAGATGSAGSRALRSSAEAAEWPRASFFSSGWAWCSLWLLWARGDDGPALPCHGAAASACKGHIISCSTWLWHACEYCHVSACLYMVRVARSRSDVHISYTLATGVWYCGTLYVRTICDMHV